MATLVLTAVGTAIAGPIGGALGGLIGGAVDRTVLFAPAPREGPRLNDLRVQTSSYGTPVPLLFGTMRVAGSVIWATDLEEHRDEVAGGKGQGSVNAYSYTASFAVALSGRPVRAVRRIWAEGKLLRGAAGDWKSDLGGFRLHPGGEDQAPDPLIAAREGGGLSPAHRGCAYAVFEDLALAGFGNRLPSLTFEVEADAGAVTAGFVAERATDRLVSDGGLAVALGGYAAHGPGRTLLEDLARATGASFAPAGSGLAMRGAGEPVATLADAGVTAGERGGRPGARAIEPVDATPRRLAIGHYDPARDYQIGLQRAERPGAGRREDRLDLPAALDASAAKHLAGAALARAGARRVRRTVAPGWDALGLVPGDVVTLAGEPGAWQIARWTLEGMALTVELLPLAPVPLATQASAGRAVAAADVAHGPTVVHLVELPALTDAALTGPRLLAVAAGPSPGWRRAALLLSLDGGASWQPRGTTAAPGVIGTVSRAAEAGPATLADERNSLEVTLLHAGMTLGPSNAGRIDAGANLALAGDELLQFARAEPLGGVRWRLSGLWRGRRGTEAAIGTGAAGDRFVLLEPGSVATLDLDATALGATARLLAAGIGDAVPAEAEARVSGASARPPSPVHLVQRASGADLTVRWTRRSRMGWRWIDGVDAGLGEARERYRATILFADGGERAVETELPLLIITAADRAAGATAVRVVQIGDLGESPPALLILDSPGAPA